jgi:hypothetical protein
MSLSSDETPSNGWGLIRTGGQFADATRDVLRRKVPNNWPKMA